MSTHHPSPITHHPKTGTVLAFDFGEKRIGVAVGDLAIGIAHPLTIITGADNRTRFAAIAALIEEWRPLLLIVGLPTHPDGAEHEVGRLARRFAQRLEGRFGLATRLVDERLTSRAAETRLREQGMRGKKLNARLDTVAAQEILQGYFETARRDAGSES
ncbi:MAG: Holliday junction DNA helicase RuvA [Betaproteobacteria bacterium RIFCSPLOWO2_12_FULL_62_13]|nr:MAG: Holliday junction DNA helicase RuvA [Betaproteobacteria bacterium RIFCSPLOWO2_12_FULL_62_13]